MLSRVLWCFLMHINHCFSTSIKFGKTANAFNFMLIILTDTFWFWFNIPFTCFICGKVCWQNIHCLTRRTAAQIIPVQINPVCFNTVFCISRIIWFSWMPMWVTVFTPIIPFPATPRFTPTATWLGQSNK